MRYLLEIIRVNSVTAVIFLGRPAASHFRDLIAPLNALFVCGGDFRFARFLFP